MLDLLALLACVLACSFVVLRKKSSMRYIPGPSSPSFLLGNLPQLFLSARYGEHEFKWQKQYGPFYRIKGCFLEDRLMVSDPISLKHILNNPEIFTRSFQQRGVVQLLAGDKSVLNAEGSDHRRFRNIMNSAFTPTRIRELSPTFELLADKLIANWDSVLSKKDHGDIFDLFPSLSHATLDAVGNGAFGYDFGSLDGRTNKLGDLHRNILSMAGSQSKTDILFESLVPRLPQFVLDLAYHAPTQAMKTLLHYRTAGDQVSHELVKTRQENSALRVEAGKDLLNVMVQANNSAKESQRMSSLEIEHQITTILVAGQDTTGNTFALALLELAKNIVLQAAIREEITNAYEESNGHFGTSDIEKLRLFNAFIQEVLRFYPALPMTERVAAHDTVIPLSKPLINTLGDAITEVHVPKGQHIVVALASFNRLESVWGHDASTFRPSRWLNGELAKGPTFGPFAGLGTFIGGPRVCIGWRFAVAELQVILSSLIRKFEFRLPEGADLREAYALSMVTMSKDTGRICLPLHVKKVEVQ